jgi:hypothetical protein
MRWGWGEKKEDRNFQYKRGGRGMNVKKRNEKEMKKRRAEDNG